MQRGIVRTAPKSIAKNSINYLQIMIVILIVCRKLVAKMFIQKIHKKTKTKTYTSVVLMENYREGKKVKHRVKI